MKGTYTLNFGANRHSDEIDSTFVGSSLCTGGFDFNGSETGIDFADFLVGAPYSFENIGFPPLNTDAQRPDNNVNWANYLPIASSPGFWHNNVLPYTKAWSFSIQWELGRSTLFNISHVGSEGRHGVGAVESNPRNPVLCLSLSQPAGSPAAMALGTPGVVPGTQQRGSNAETNIFYAAAGGQADGTREPFGHDFGSNDDVMSLANSAYSPLEGTMRRTSGQGELLASYTYSKSLDNYAL
ncbi:MAG: hypothetical protein ACLQVL_34085 [Terriglobia bacterium]